MVRTCYEQGIFPADTLIWFDGAPEWMPIQNVFTEQRQAPSMPSAPETSVPPSAASAAESVVATPVAADVQLTPSVATISAPQPSMPGTSAGSVATPPPFVPSSCPVPPPFPLQEEATYYVALPGMQPQGPYTKSAVLSGYYQGAYPAGTMVWGPETASWIPITALPQFAASPVQGGNAISRQFQTWGKAKDWNPVNAFVSCMKRYAQFSGRASRPEYWYCQLALFILLLLVGVGRVALEACDAELVGMLLALIVRLAIIVPMFALAVRRCHDTGRCGWYILIPIYGWVIFFLPSTNGNNQYGSAPLPPA